MGGRAAYLGRKKVSSQMNDGQKRKRKNSRPPGSTGLILRGEDVGVGKLREATLNSEVQVKGVELEQNNLNSS